MKRRLLLSGLLFCLPFCQPLLAQAERQCVVVETSAGQRMEYLLSDLPRIVHSDATVTLTTATATVELQTAEVAKVYLATTTIDTAVREVTQDGKVRLSADHAVLSGYAPREAVGLYATDGRLLKQLATDANGHLTITLSQLRAGTYIIKTKQQSIKFTKK